MWRLLIVIAALVIAGLGISTAGIGAPPAPARWIMPPPEVFRPVPTRQALQLHIADFAFDPSVVQAAEGVPITLELINSGPSVHILVIPVLGVRAPLQPGQRQEVYLGKVEPGVYEFFCAIPAHRDMGMIGRLIVGPELARVR